MRNDEILQRIKGGLVVSCQALEGEPLHSSYIMGRMAFAAYEGGAVAIRANTPEDIREIKKTVGLPVIGLHKVDYPDSEIYITPTMKEIDGLIQAGCDIIAIDATKRIRPKGQTLDELFRQARSKYPDQLFMADTSCYEEGLHAQELGFDLVGTTMSGYTEYTKGTVLPNYDLMKRYVDTLNIPVVAEGGIWSPEQLHKAFAAGVWTAVVGTAITRPREITRRFVNALS
ncbi:N-acetylmannosamine-6-phosphate 2-epimerase [Caproiciproducens galactitolivorans]|uniref:Putative N-acetylmannosamine-6-phosphate 2-epimerase n=1 Tax=Caproiciproducens galactitolivorans TaxID=642589 RepID=A0ABT4BUB5_9FIRM|nr:N-acetylmannosamine-6-phosphate 2-epimerase [Caproiciproducens galactitolivorans]MCY1713516.1 N-acetylmannosamine-6-phosphate 2-epimerase [Caproiciproducens galactitolivorans]